MTELVVVVVVVVFVSTGKFWCSSHMGPGSRALALPFQQDVPEARQEGREVVTVACWQVEVLLVTGVQE